MTATKDDKVEEPAVEQQEVETEETVVSETVDASEIVDETASDASTEESEPTEEPKEELSDEERKNLSEKAQKRFGKLANKAAKTDQLEKEVRELRENQGSEFTSGLPEPTAVSRQAPKLPWETKAEAGEDPVVTKDDFKRDVIANADFIVNQRIEQAEARASKTAEIQTDLLEVQQKHERLNPKSESFDKELSTNLATLYGNQLKADPKARLLNFVDTVMDVRKSGKEEGKVEATAQINDQEAESPLDPSETGAEEAPIKFEELSIDKQEQYLKDHGHWES